MARCGRINRPTSLTRVVQLEPDGLRGFPDGLVAIGEVSLLASCTRSHGETLEPLGWAWAVDRVVGTSNANNHATLNFNIAKLVKVARIDPYDYDTNFCPKVALASSLRRSRLIKTCSLSFSSEVEAITIMVS